jgi:phospholipase/lecithinase/hemolysin
MKFNPIRSIVSATLAALALVACGGGDSDTPERVTFGKMVSFGDSLSDVGSYRTPALAAAYGGGKYTVNGAGDSVWTERVAAELGLPAPCAAQTGLQASGPFADLAAAVTNVAGCYCYAQGGSRVTNPVGPWNAALLLLTPPNTQGYLGQLTKPLIEQMQRHLAASGGAFAADDLVTVFAGGNDVFMNLATVSATVAAGGNAAAAGQAAVNAMGLAGGELAAYIKALLVAKGAKQIVVVKLPDVSKTPFGASVDQATRDLIEMMSFTFNAFLEEGLKGVSEVLVVDAYTSVRKQWTNPAAYGLTNLAIPACATFAPAGQPVSLFCSSATLNPAVDVATSAFADGVHPTPKGHQLLADDVLAAMRTRGWAP